MAQYFGRIPARFRLDVSNLSSMMEARMSPQLSVRLLLITLAFTSTAVTRAQSNSTRALTIAKDVSLSLPANWQAKPQTQSNLIEIFARESIPGNQGVLRQSRILIHVENRLSFQDAQKRLADIAAELPNSRPEFLTISGWPALARHYQLPQEQPGIMHDESAPASSESSLPVTQRMTIAIAAGTRLFRIDSVLAPKANPDLDKEAELIGRSLQIPPPTVAQQAEIKQTLNRLSERFIKKSLAPLEQKAPVAKRFIPPGILLPPNAGFTLGGLQIATSPTTAVATNRGRGELELVVSNDGENVIVASNNGFGVSHDGGQTFPSGGPTPGNFPHDGDPSLALGASPTFYYGFLGNPDGSAGAKGATGCSVSLAASTDTGNTFVLRSHAVLCQDGTNACGPDQEHIAADRLHGTSSGDQVYVVWRNFLPDTQSKTQKCDAISGSPTPSIVCSKDGGNTWSNSQGIGSGDFPRITVGGDGSVYVIYRSNSNIMLSKYSSCSSGLQLQSGYPSLVSSVNDVTCPVPGLDRCNNGNLLSSHMVAVDTNNPFHVYAAFASNNGGGEDIVVKDSEDGGLTFPREIVVNSGPASARRFLPWVCPVDDAAFVSWYDRRKASQPIPPSSACTNKCETAFQDCEKAGLSPRICGPGRSQCLAACDRYTTDDLTEYFYAFARPQGSSLQASGEADLSGTPDPQCASPWPDGTRSAADFTSCTIQPTGTINVDSSKGGQPKYGDYNGNACAPGRAYFAWASGTAPAGLAPISGIQLFFAANPQPAVLTVNERMSGTGAAGHFYLTIDGVARSTQITGSGSTGQVVVLPSTLHAVGERAGSGTSLINFSTVIGGDCAADGSITLNPGDNRTCTITNTRRPKTDCINECTNIHNTCVTGVGQRGGLSNAQCNEIFISCKQQCNE
jgi:hypothetical protein